MKLEPTEIINDPQIERILLDIYNNSIEVTNKNENVFQNIILNATGLVKNGKFMSTLFPITKKQETNKKFTAQEFIVFDLLKDNLNKIVSKDKIAKHVWGNKWIDQYSEQALDKLISRLKSKINSTEFDIIVIRNRGIRLSLSSK